MLFESIKNKNFLLLYNSLNNENDVDQLLFELRNIPSDMFTSYEHYRYYKRYILPKLKLVGKEYYWKSKLYPYYEYKFRHTLVIGLCEKYLILNLRTMVYRKHRSDSEDHYNLWNQNEHVYLIGFNSDGKLFVNEIPNTSFPSMLVDFKVFGSGVVELRIIDYNEIVGYLGFNYDAADMENIVIDRVGRYRIQGEIVLHVDRELGNVDEFYKVMVRRSQIVDYVETYIANYIALALIDLGFSIEYGKSFTLRNVLPSKIIKKPKKIMNILRRLGDSLIDELRKYIEINSVVISEVDDVVLYKYSREYTISSNISLFRLRVIFDYFKPRPFQQPYSDIVVSVEINTILDYDYCIMCKEIEKELINELKSSPRQNIKMLLGNHLIEMKNVYSGSIIFRPSKRLEIELFRLPSITNNINAYYVDSESEIEIVHREHGATKIRFSKPFLVNFTTTTVLADYTEKLNRVVLGNLVNNKKMVDYL